MPADADFYALELLLDDQDRTLLHRVRAFMAKEVQPIINHYWTRARFPHELLPGLAELHIAGLPYAGYGCPGKSPLLDGMVAMELARTDPSIATFMGVHGGLAMGSIYLCGSEEQKRRWLPAMARMELLGAFGLTELEVGSGASRGLATTARRDGDAWVLAGHKKWIGNASFADLTVIWARDVDDGQVKGFVVEAGTPGFATENLQDKIALRVVQNALITLEDVRIPDANQLQAAGLAADEHASLAKAFCTVRMRETVGWARELLGGNGILLEHHVGRFVADAEAIYSYEGTREINTLIVGRAITGLSAFV